MISAVRKEYNKNFSEEKYEEFFKSLYERFPYQIEFKVCETPIFISKEFMETLLRASDEIVEILYRNDFKDITKNAVPKHLNVPGEDERPVFLALDFGVCTDAENNIVPQLIEMQGFASLYGYQNELGVKYKKYFTIPENATHLLNNLSEEDYKNLFRKTVLGDHAPEHVILLEIEPSKQKTWIDFWITKEICGIEPVCISEIIKEGDNLYYYLNGKKTQIKRIYDRLIFDEFELRTDLKVQWHPAEPAHVEWVSHPNWFFRISKYILPFLKSKYVPETYFLNEMNIIPQDLENWVLKPLFSFAGSGVVFDVKKEDIDALQDKENFILQRKVNYFPCIETLDQPAKCEIRMMYIWEKEKEKPTPVINLVRLSKGAMIGVNFNKGKSWVGGTVGYIIS